MWFGKEIQTVLYEKNIRIKNKNKKGCDYVVELDQFKYTLNGYEGPLEELRDSL